MFLPRSDVDNDMLMPTMDASLSHVAQPAIAPRVNSFIPETTPVTVVNVLINLAISSISIALLSPSPRTPVPLSQVDTDSIFPAYRCTLVKNWSRVPLAMWLVFLVFGSAWIFAFTTAVFQYIVKFNSSPLACHSTTQACIAFFITTKLPRMDRGYFLHAGDSTYRPAQLYRLRWALQCIPYHALSRSTYKIAFVPPSERQQSSTGKPFERPARELSIRTFTGSCLALLSISANMIVFTVFEDEPMWMCMVSCQSDGEPACLFFHLFGGPLDNTGRTLGAARRRPINLRILGRNGRFQHAPIHAEELKIGREGDDSTLKAVQTRHSP
ncbi:hypothetical protein PG994_006510 [Apiospora phragmitis]|uniref:Uncharacterized protein n=1 Tax=Apiospora phragmitis TaxID=2905665 RepID=A0ABR1VF94_9PEZI